MNSPPKQFETKRLQLRKPLLSDAVPIFEQYAQDEEVTKYLTWQPHKNLKETKEFLRRCVNVWKEGTAFPWSIIRKSDQQFLGMIEIVSVDHSGLNVGYVLAKKYWGQGLMSETLRAILEYGFSTLKFSKIEAHTYTANMRAKHLLEKLGFQVEKITHDSHYFFLTEAL